VTPEQIVLRFVESIGGSDEARAYLELFRSGEPERFALIDASGDLAGPEALALSADLSYLIALGLSPVLWCEPGATSESLAGLPIDDVSTAEKVRAAASGRRLARVSSDDIASWANALATRKVILLGGPLRDPVGAVIPMVDCATELGTVEVAAGHRPRLDRAAAIVASTSQPIAVALTSAVDLLRELFTVRGAGTLVRRGAAIERRTSIADRAAMSSLLENAFAKRVRPELFERRFSAVYIAGDHAGAALIEPDVPAPYLSKFAVGMAARGEGIGRDLWRRLVADFSRLYWRARPANPITGWYLRKSDGFCRAGEWNVFWIGLEPHEIAAAIARATERSPDFAL
jgi:acetylglutamate kinase